MKIRCSYLPMYCDCPRRTAAKLLKSHISASGFDIPEDCKGVAACVGTGTHKGAEMLLNEAINIGITPSLANVTDTGIQEYRQEVYEGVQFDDITANNNEAEKQIQILTRSYYYEIFPKKNLNNAKAEESLKAVFGTDEVTGHCDFSNLEEITDVKTGKVSIYSAQCGGYSLLKRSQGHEVVKKLKCEFLPRTPLRKNYPGAVVHEYNVYNSEKHAFNVIKLIKKNVADFMESGDPWSFAANPKSMLCSPKYCSAYGTEFCEVGANK